MRGAVPGSWCTSADGCVTASPLAVDRGLTGNVNGWKCAFGVIVHPGSFSVLVVSRHFWCTVREPRTVHQSRHTPGAPCDTCSGRVSWCPLLRSGCPHCAQAPRCGPHHLVLHCLRVPAFKYFSCNRSPRSLSGDMVLRHPRLSSPLATTHIISKWRRGARLLWTQSAICGQLTDATTCLCILSPSFWACVVVSPFRGDVAAHPHHARPTGRRP